VALILAMSRALVVRGGRQVSVYEDRGILSLGA
jgi:hypothetical protein